VLAEAGADGPEIISAEIDPALSADARARIPALKNERPFSVPEADQIPMRSAS
jgi:predicted amidohydrolase